MNPHPKENTTTYRTFPEKLGGSPISEFVGEFGELFYDPANHTSNTLRISDGKTKGGIVIAGGSGTDTDALLKIGDNISELNNDSGYITGVDKLSDIGDVSIGGVTSGQSLTYNGNNWVAETPEIVADNLVFQRSIDFTNVEAPSNPEVGWYYFSIGGGSAHPSWNGVSSGNLANGDRVVYGADGEWYVAGNINDSGNLTLDSLSVNNEDPSGSGDLSYNNSNGVFTFTPPLIGDGQINVNAGDGLSAAGSNATANQSGDTTRTLSVKTGDGITIDGSGNVIIDPNYNLDGNVTPPNDGKLTIKSSNGATLGEFTANQDGDTEVVIPSGGGGGGGDLGCDGVADCLVNAPVDEPKYAFAAPVYLNGFVYTEKPPHPPEDHASRPFLYFKKCDPDDHHMLELGEEGHGYSGGNETIYRLPGTYIYYQGVEISIVASPPVYVDDRDAIYGFHPDDILVRDLKVFKGDYEKGVTTTEQLWTGGELKSDNTGKSVGSFKLQPNYSFDAGVEENFFRVEFTCHRGDTYMYVFIVPHCDIPPGLPGTTTRVNLEIPNITINPTEDN